VFLNYSLARRERQYIYFFTVLTVIEIGALYVFGSAITSLLTVMIVINSIGIIGGAVYIYLRSQRGE